MFLKKHVFMEEAGAEGIPAGGALPQLSPSGEGAPPLSVAPDDWRSTLPPDLQASPSLKDIPDVVTLAKNYEHTKTLVGNSIRLPSAEAGQADIEAVTQKLLENGNLPLMRKPDFENPESLAEIHKALGRPEDVSGYQAPEGADAELFGTLSETALSLGLTKGQYEGLASAMTQQQQAVMEKYEQDRAAGVSQLRGEWGPAYEQKITRATQVAEALGAPGSLVEALRQGSANAEAIRFMDTIATQLGQEGSQVANQINAVTEATAADIQQRIEERTRRMIQDSSITPAERQRLIQANVADQEKLLAVK